MDIVRIILLACFISVLLSCGMQTLAEDARDLSAQANEGVAESNQTSKEMLLLQIKMLEYMQKTDEMTRKLSQLSTSADEKMALTLEQMRRQSVAIAIEGLFKEENTAQLDPPTKMLPYAQAFGEDANETEISEFSYILWHDAMYGSGSLRSKEITLNALALIGGFIPNEKMRRVQVIQIDGKGLYEEHTYKLLWGRYRVERDLHFDSYVDDSVTLNKGSLKHVVAHFQELQYLAALPYVAKLKVSIPMMITDQVNPNEVKTLATKAKNAFNAKMTPAELADPEVQELLKAFNI